MRGEGKGLMLVLGMTILLLAEATHTTSSPMLEFYNLGDWGLPGSFQVKVADAMKNRHNQHPVDFLVSVGDNFYDSGVSSVDDAQWKNSYTDIYGDMKLKWYSILGNHDYVLSPEAQIQYYKDHESEQNWIMKDYYYSENFTVCGSDAHSSDCFSTIFIFLDTMPLNPDMDSKAVVKHAETKAQLQLAWLESTLKAAQNYDWKFIVQHYPIYSAGANGDNTVLQKVLWDLFITYKVDAIFAGHDHSMQLLSLDGLRMYISGAGAKLSNLNNLKSTKAKVEYAEVRLGFMHHQVVSKEQMNVTVVDGEGNEVFNYQHRKDATSGGHGHNEDSTIIIGGNWGLSVKILIGVGALVVALMAWIVFSKISKSSAVATGEHAPAQRSIAAGYGSMA